MNDQFRVPSLCSKQSQMQSYTAVAPMKSVFWRLSFFPGDNPFGQFS
jgi:hypothetical protein